MVTHLDTQGELVVERVVVTGQDVQRRVAVVVLGHTVSARVVGVVAGQVVSAIVGVGSRLVARGRDVPTELCAQEEVLNGSEVERERADETVGLIEEQVLLQAEQRVEQVTVGVVVGIAHVRAVLGIDVAHVVHIGPAIRAGDGAVGTTQGLVVLHVYVLHTGLHVQPLGQLGTAGQRQVGTLQVGGLDHTVLVDERCAGAQAHAVVTGLEGHVVLHQETRLEHGLRVVIVRNRTIIQRTEVVGVVIVRCAVGTVGVDILNLGPAVGLAPRELVAVGDAGAARAAFLRRDDDGAVRGVRAVECGGCGTLQHRHALDVLGVEVVTTAGVVGVTHRQAHDVVATGEALGRVERGVVHGDTVHDIERLVVARQRGCATQHHRSRSTGSATRADHVHTRDTTLQCRDEVSSARLDDVAGLDVLNRRAHRAGHTFHTELSSHHHLVELTLVVEHHHLCCL